MDGEVYESDVNKSKFKELPNFFNFIEADVKTVFGEKGAFLIQTIPNIAMVYEKYGKDFCELCMTLISQSINNMIAQYKQIYAFKFGNSDFIMICQDYRGLDMKQIAAEIKSDFIKSLSDRNLDFIELDNYVLEYDEEITSIEEFYELLFDKVSSIGGDKVTPKRMIKHIIGTFTKNIRDTLSSFRYANNLAFTDDVSGLSNHRAGKLFISDLIKEHQINDNGFSVMFIDGDNLKRYNKLSYEAGNKMIRDIGKIISSSIRREDKVFRWLSGDEFLVVLKGTDKDNCSKLAERVRESVERQTKDFIYPTTISIGIAHYPSDGDSLEELITKAERANSYAKDIGRNRVVRWDGNMHYMHL